MKLSELVEGYPENKETMNSFNYNSECTCEYCKIITAMREPRGKEILVDEEAYKKIMGKEIREKA